MPRMLRWVCQRHLEMLLFSRFDGGSTGAVWKALNLSGLDSTSLCCNKKAVSEGLVTQAELAQILTASHLKAVPEEAHGARLKLKTSLHPSASSPTW